MLARHGLVEAVLLNLDNPPIRTGQEVFVLVRPLDVMGGVVRANDQRELRVLLPTLDQVVLHPLRADLVGHVVRASQVAGAGHGAEPGWLV